MSDWVKLQAQDGHELAAYVARPAGKPLGGIVLVQEIFGVNPSIQHACDSFAAEGYVVIAPAIFDRTKRDIQLGYGPIDKAEAFALMAFLKPETTLLDIAAAYQFLKADGLAKSAVLGFCYGGFAAWISATRGAQVGFTPACAVAFYPGGIGKVAAETPVCPVQIHIGDQDSHIGKDQIEAVRAAHPEIPLYTYAGADHAFANPDRPEFAPEAFALASQRTRDFLRANLA